MGPQYGIVFVARGFLKNLYSGSACNVRMTDGCRIGKDLENVGSSYHQCHWNRVQMLLRLRKMEQLNKIK